MTALLFVFVLQLLNCVSSVSKLLLKMEKNRAELKCINIFSFVSCVKQQFITLSRNSNTPPNDNIIPLQLPNVVLENPFLSADGGEPSWWNLYRTKYGKRAKKCTNIPLQPTNGTICPKKKIGDYNCFFGNQWCAHEENSIHPKVKCDCLNRVWHCNEYHPCEQSKTDQQQQSNSWTTCPQQHPLNFNSVQTCSAASDKPLICNYGEQTCCGKFQS